jgi:hypothetical protein
MDYMKVLEEIKTKGKISNKTNEELILKATRTLRNYFHEITEFINFRLEG